MLAHAADHVIFRTSALSRCHHLRHLAKDTVDCTCFVCVRCAVGVGDSVGGSIGAFDALLPRVGKSK